ncbi:DegV family protein [Anaerocaecibacter muris]|uniref:DegV family protein n=1 Tax=Anaerocaecibacter muris TaxID=2941513 RepID=UPI00203D042A|nr:DegV family protein [Anaerocaecibacter muris]
MSFTLSADTSCDILRNEMTARGIEYRPLVYTIDDVPHFDEFTKDEDYKGFYDQIRAGKMPTTSQINIVEHEEFFETLLDKYEGDIVHVTLSSGLSSTYASACKAAENVNEKHGKRVYVVDSLGATIATRHVVDEAQRLRDGGVCAADAAEQLKQFTYKLQTWFMPTDLMHLKRGGRVSGPSAYIGTALNIKPIINFDKYGALAVVQKKMGAGKGIAAMVEAFKKLSAAVPHKVYIASADSEFAEELLQKAKAVRPDCQFEIGWIGPVIGAHTGCNAVGISFVSDSSRA